MADGARRWRRRWGQIITSWLAAELTPTYSWRILWLIGLPTGVVLVVLNRWIPESPRFLIHAGRHREAWAVMARYGATVTDDLRPGLEREEAVGDRWAQLLARPFRCLTGMVVLFGDRGRSRHLWLPAVDPLEPAAPRL